MGAGVQGLPWPEGTHVRHEAGRAQPVGLGSVEGVPAASTTRTAAGLLSQTGKGLGSWVSLRDRHSTFFARTSAC